MALAVSVRSFQNNRSKPNSALRTAFHVSLMPYGGSDRCTLDTSSKLEEPRWYICRTVVSCAGLYSKSRRQTPMAHRADHLHDLRAGYKLVGRCTVMVHFRGLESPRLQFNFNAHLVQVEPRDPKRPERMNKDAWSVGVTSAGRGMQGRRNRKADILYLLGDGCLSYKFTASTAYALHDLEFRERPDVPWCC